MDKITIHNYEAFFLDHLEGNLSQENSAQLEAFLDANPHLRDELELDALPTLAIGNPSMQRQNWEHLLMPGKGHAAERDLLFFKSLERTLTGIEQDRLSAILSTPEFAKEHALWLKLKLHKEESELFNGDAFYQFGYSLPLSNLSWDHYLIARSEGLLSLEQNEALEQYASTFPDGKRLLAISDQLRLKPANGIFFPNKDFLYKKEKAVTLVLWYRIAGIAAAVLLAFALWMWNGVNTTEPQLANEKVEGKGMKEQTATPANPAADTSGRETKSPDQLQSPPLHEWELREPDASGFASAPRKQIKSENPVVDDTVPAKDEEFEIQAHPTIEHTELAEVEKTEPHTGLDEITTIDPVQQNTTSTTDVKGNESYKSLGEIAEEKFKQQLDLSDAERDALALTFAKRAAEKAGALIDAEINKSKTVTEQGENLTYSFRMGTFKVSHSKSK